MDFLNNGQSDCDTLCQLFEGIKINNCNAIIKNSSVNVCTDNKKDEPQIYYPNCITISKGLRHYRPSEVMMKSHRNNFSYKSLAVSHPLFEKFLKDRTVNYDNATVVLRQLLCIEDLTTMHTFTQLFQANVSVFKISATRFFFLLNNTIVNPINVLTPHVDEVVLVPKASVLSSPYPNNLIMTLFKNEHENLPSSDPRCRLVGNIIDVKSMSVEIELKSPIESIPNCVDIIIRSNRLLVRYMYRALQWLNECPDLRRYFFPVKRKLQLPKVFYLELINKHIKYNPEQLQAVQQIVSGPNNQAPFILFGPPGTGKTTTIVEAILQLCFHQPQSCILVTAGSNSACDTIALRICQYIRKIPTIGINFKRMYSRFIVNKGHDSINPALLYYSNYYDIIHNQAVKLSNFNIIVATLCTVGSLVTRNLKSVKITHIFIDEAGASTEPESLVGIMGVKLTSKCHVILSGDHKQLGAVIKSNRAASLGLGCSLMERLLQNECYAVDVNGNYDRTLQARLRYNYRSHPAIVRLYNSLYYNNELIAAAKLQDVNWAEKWCMLHNRTFPIIFHSTHGITEKDPDSTSIMNVLEVDVVGWYVWQLLNSIDIRVQQQDIGIITPYAAQSKKLVAFLNSKGINNIDVGTVEAYQGREKPIVIVSLVRSYSQLGFLTNPHRLNVLLSRAKSLLVIIGNPITLGHHKDYKFIIDECKAQGNYV